MSDTDTRTTTTDPGLDETTEGQEGARRAAEAAWDAAIHHVEPMLSKADKRAAMADNPHRLRDTGHVEAHDDQVRRQERERIAREMPSRIVTVRGRGGFAEWLAAQD